MAPEFPFPPPTPEKRLGWMSWALIAGMILVLIVLALIVMYSGR
jgi:hypothetical protein